MGGLLLGRFDDGCGLEAGGNAAVAEREVGDGGENISQHREPAQAPGLVQVPYVTVIYSFQSV